MRSVVNAALNAVRREARGQRLPFEDSSELEALLDKAASAAEQVELKELNRRILEALRKLPPRAARRDCTALLPGDERKENGRSA